MERLFTQSNIKINNSVFKPDKQIAKGFTLVELMIATAVFSMVLLVAVTTFIEIGRLFYKGLTTTQTASVAKQTINLISKDIQSSTAVTPITVYNGLNYFCVGNSRYTFNYDTMVDINSNNPANFGILQDKLPGSNSCAPPCINSCGSGEVTVNNATELLGNRMRLDTISLQDAGFSNVKNVSIKIVYGDDTTITNNNPSNPSSENLFCNAVLRTSQFCSESFLSNVVLVNDYAPE